MLSRFHLIPERNGQTGGQICYINIARQYAERDKKTRPGTTCACLAVVSKQESCRDSMPSSL